MLTTLSGTNKPYDQFVREQIAGDDEVSPGFPELFQTKPPTIPQPEDDAKTAGRRKVLAAWITSPDNRMTARVMDRRCV